MSWWLTQCVYYITVDCNNFLTYNLPTTSWKVHFSYQCYWRVGSEERWRKYILYKSCRQIIRDFTSKSKVLTLQWHCDSHKIYCFLVLKMRTYLSNQIMLGKSVVIENSEHQGLVEGVCIGKILELKSFIEKWIQSFSVNFRFKLFLPFLWWQHEHLESLK